MNKFIRNSRYKWIYLFYQFFINLGKIITVLRNIIVFYYYYFHYIIKNMKIEKEKNP